MKIALKIIGGIIGLVAAVILIAGIVLIIVVDKEFIQDRMREALNRHVTIESIDVGIFSAISGIEVNGVYISNYKNARQLEALRDKPVPSKDVFVSLNSFTFKVSLLPLVHRQLVLRELVLREPKISVVKNENGGYNFDDLLKPKPMTAEEKAEAERKKKEEALEPDKPMTADDIPVAVSVGKIGIEKGRLSYLDKKYDQTFEVYDLAAFVKNVDIDPKALEKHDSLKIELDFGVKTTGPMKSGSVKSFDIGFAVDADARPFDLKTRKLDPELTIKAGMPRGSLTGLQIFEELKKIEALTKYIGKVGFLKDTVTWKDAFVKAWYKAGTVKLEDGTLKTDDFNLGYAGKANVNSKDIDVKLDMVVAEKYDKEIRKSLESNVKKVLTGKLAKVVKPEKLVDEAMKPLVNKDGRIFLGYEVGGTMSKPEASLVHPKLGSLGDLAKDAAGMAVEAAKEAAEKEVNKAVDKATDKAADEVKKAEKSAGKEINKSTKSLKKKLKF
ncbi:MAG TPA: AsmA family protein [Spirochaetota bacterium]|nr:AsmA family protein [Spirochaetota bacterium]